MLFESNLYSRKDKNLNIYKINIDKFSSCLTLRKHIFKNVLKIRISDSE